MGKIKFSYTSLLDCKARIDYTARELQKYVDEAIVLINGFEPEKQYWLTQSLNGIIGSIDRLTIMSGKLAKLADLYNEGERTVENIVRRLFVPVPIHSQQSISIAAIPFITEYSASHTMPRDLFVESWIMELIYSEVNIN